jgi:hypothetical protein
MLEILYCLTKLVGFFLEQTTTTTEPLIPNKVGYARNETQSKIIEIRDLYLTHCHLGSVQNIYKP